jgi:hypothetical protein
MPFQEKYEVACHMNHYEADVSILIKEMFPKEKTLNVSELLFTMHSGWDKMQTDSGLITSIGMDILKDSGVVPTADNIWAVLKNAPVQMFWELMSVLYGTSIYVKDINLIDAMLNTDIEALMGDVRLPFPVCEFVFPEHISLGISDYDISGCLICDVDTAPINLLMQQAKFKWEIGYPDEVKKLFFHPSTEKG